MSAETIGHYELEGLLGEGGIGQVYAAHDTVLGRKVAIKMLRPELSRDRNFVERFYVEAKSLGNLNHSNITTIYALHAEGDEAFMVMELVLGQTLEALLARAQRLTLRDSLAVLAQAVVGMRYAHRRGVIHRDLKPANLMVTDDGVIKIMDFGIARVQGSQHLTRVGEFCGTFVYASPEQIRGEEVDERSDLYSLAIVLYRMLAGTAPFTGDNEYALMTAQLQTPPPPLAGRVPDLDPDTEQVLMRALAKRPEDRFASVEEFGRAIGAMALRGESVEILTQLYTRVFENEDLEATRIVGRTGSRPGVEQTMPSNRRVFQLSGAGSSLPSLALSRPALSRPAPSAPRSSRPGRISFALTDPPATPLGIELPPLPTKPRPNRRPLLLGVSAIALSLSLLAAGGYYWTTLDEPVPPPTALTQPPRPTEIATPTPTPVQSAAVQPATREEPAPTPPPPAVEVVKNEPARVEPAKVEPALLPAVTQTAKPEPEKPAVQPVQAAANPEATAVQAPPAPVDPVKAEPVVPVQPIAPTQKVKDEPAPSSPPVRVEPVKAEPPPAPPVPATVEPASPPVLPSGANSETRLAAASPALVVPPTPEIKPETPPNAVAATVQEPAPTNGQPGAEVKVAKAEQPASPDPQAPLGPQVQASPPGPEGEPDLQGRVSGAKRFDELEVAGRWIKLYGIVDRARGAREAQQVQVLLRYLKPARNVLACYSKPGDTYRCYADGKDIAQRALLDGVVQLAPNAPAEYRALAQKR